MQRNMHQGRIVRFVPLISVLMLATAWCLAPQDRSRERRQGRFRVRLWVLLLLIAGLGCWLGVTLQTLRPKTERSGPANILEQLDETRP